MKIFRRPVDAALCSYVEMHSCPPFFPSRYFRREPEVVADAPWRVVRGRDIPVAIMIRDAHLYPAELVSLQIVDGEGRCLARREYNQILKEPFFHELITLPVTEHFPDHPLQILLNVDIELRVGKKQIRVRNHNLKTLSHDALDIRIAEAPLPGPENLLYGDIHCHSEFTWDEIEYGAPIPVLAAFAAAMGLHWQPVTDHSYDLDRDLYSLQRAADGFPRWEELGRQVRAHSSPELLMIRGEELSCGNRRRQNVHMLILGHDECIRGRGDAGDLLLRNKADQQADDVARRVAPARPCIAAHPYENIPRAERWLLNRGQWDEDPDPAIRGLQILNGRLDESWDRGRKIWIQRLLRGEKRFIYAGNDAHGNFNRYQQIHIPLWSLTQDREKRFGRFMTAVWVSEPKEAALLDALSAGNCFIGSGPMLILGSGNVEAFQSRMGETLTGESLSVFFESSCAEDREGVIRIWAGTGEGLRERHLLAFHPDTSLNRTEISSHLLGDELYVRAEFRSAANVALTNPVWFDRVDLP